ncbi:MAG: hypothetical protein ABEH43_03290, partial [Flavobacteriales bacterium]
HSAILKAFDFSGNEMSSFFLSNKNWDRGEEVPLMDMGFDDSSSKRTMDKTKIDDVIGKDGELKMVYVYDFMKMWCFFVDLVEVSEDKNIKSDDLPYVDLKYGTPPDENSREMDPLKGMGTGGSQEENNGDLGDEIDDMFKN